MQEQLQTPQPTKAPSSSSRKLIVGLSALIILLTVLITGGILLLMNRSASGNGTLQTSSSTSSDILTSGESSSGASTTTQSPSSISNYIVKQFTLHFKPDNQVQPTMQWDITTEILETAIASIKNTEVNYTFEQLTIDTPDYRVQLKGTLDGGLTKFETMYADVITNASISTTGQVFRLNSQGVIKYASLFWQGKEKCGTEYDPATGKSEAVKYCGTYGLDKAQLSISCEILNQSASDKAIADCNRLIQSMKVIVSN